MQGEEEYRERRYIGEHHRSEDPVFLRWGKSQASDVRCRVEESGAAKRPCFHLSLSPAGLCSGCATLCRYSRASPSPLPQNRWELPPLPPFLTCSGFRNQTRLYLSSSDVSSDDPPKGKVDHKQQLSARSLGMPTRHLSEHCQLASNPTPALLSGGFTSTQNAELLKSESGICW